MPKKYVFEEPKMGSVVSITLFASDSLAAREAAYRAFSRIDEINLALSDYSEQSETWQLNAGQPDGWVTVGPDLLKTLLISRQVADATNGAFDPAIGNIVQLWRRARRRQELPSAEALSEARSNGGIGSIAIDTARSRIKLEVKGVRLDFGGIGKGYAMDEALKVLQENGMRRAIVSASSSIAVGAPPADKPVWEFTLSNGPAGEQGLSETISCNNCFIASSGDLYQYMELDGQRYSHIIDPSTGMALTNGAFSIVTAPSATLADAYATAFCVMDRQQVIDFVKAHPGVEAKVWKMEGGKVRSWESARFENLQTR